MDQTGWRALALAVYGPSGQLPAWHKEAACTGEDPRLFDGGNATSVRARQICAACPVQAECLTEQMAWERRQPTRYGIPAGVFGGTTASQRQAVYLAERQGDEPAGLFGRNEAA